MNTRLYRSRDDRMLAGVAGGLAELWDADPSLVRILWALLVILTGGIALVVYIVMAIVVPEELDDAPYVPAASAASAEEGAATGSSPLVATRPALTPTDARIAAREARADARVARRVARAERYARRDRGPNSGAIVVGTLFVLFGAWILVREYLPTVDFDWFWPATLLGVGLLILALAVRPRPDDGPERVGGPAAPTGRAATPVGDAGSSD